MIVSNSDLIIGGWIFMAQLWGGRFTKETDRLVYDFNASINFDKRLFEQDIEGSIAHVVMLEKQGILTVKKRIRS